MSSFLPLGTLCVNPLALTVADRRKLTSALCLQPAAQTPEVDEWAPKDPSPAASTAGRPARQNPFERSEIPAYEPPRPSRRVRENPGGKSSMVRALAFAQRERKRGCKRYRAESD